MARHPVLQVGPTLPHLAESLRAAYDVVVLPEDPSGREEVLAEHGPAVEALVVSFGVRVGADLLDRLPRLRLVANFGVGYDNVDVAAAAEREVRVTNTPDVLTDSVAELAVALALDVLRRTAAADRYVRAGRWTADGPYPLTRQLSGRRVGILGLGRIGRATATRFAAFGCPVGYHSRSPVADAPYSYAASPVDLARASDVLVVLTPGTPETEGLVDRAVLDALGPDGVLVNLARGSVVDEAALVEALLDGRLGGAGLDVYADEPHVPEALTALDSVVLLPHVGSGTVEARTAMADLVLENLARFFADGSLVTPVA